MNKVIVLIVSFLLIFNPTNLYAKSIYQKTKFHKVSCNLDNLNFKDFFICLDNNMFNDFNIKYNKSKKTNEIKHILYVASVISDAFDEKFISNQQAKDSWYQFINSSYKSKIKKKSDLSKFLEESKCLNKNIYEEFINCFYNEFRELPFYQSADIINKYRIENIVFNSLYLSKPDGIVYAYKAQGFDLPKKYENEDGFVFFNDYMSKLGSNYFLKIKDYDKEQIKKVLTFIVIALILSYVAKNLLGKSVSKGSSSSSATTSGTTTSSSTSISTICSSGYGLLCRSPGQGIQHTRWFKYAYSRGFLF